MGTAPSLFLYFFRQAAQFNVNRLIRPLRISASLSSFSLISVDFSAAAEVLLTSAEMTYVAPR